jgi:hypothetical protein
MRAERIETALWAVLAKEPACRVGVLSKELIKVSWYFSRPARLNDASRSGGEGMARPPERRQSGRCFCCHGIMFIESWRNRGISFIGGRVIVPITNVRNRHWRSFAAQC